MSLCVEQVSFSYGEREVLKELSFKAEFGRIMAVLGRNGIGKSTLFHLLLGLLPMQEGRILLNEQDLSELDTRRIAQEMAFIPQKEEGVFSFTVFEMVLMGTTPSLSRFRMPSREEERRAREALKRVGIETLEDRLYRKLSGGEQQLVLIARALAQNTRVLMMDEPCSNLDFGHQVRLMRLLRELADAGYLILMSSHDPQQVLSHADDVLFIEAGGRYDSGPAAELMSDERLSELYGMPVHIIYSASGSPAVIAEEPRV